MTLPTPDTDRHPLLDESPLPYGLPDFAAIEDSDLEPAIRTAIDDHAAEIAAIVSNPEAPTVENTVIALERSGLALTRVLSVFYGLLGPDATSARLDIDRVVSPLLAAHHSAVMTDQGLFARVDAVHSALGADGSPEAESGVDDETGRLIRRHHRDLLRAGAGLDDDGRERLTAIDTRLAGLTTAFGENLLASTSESAVHVTDESELAGLPASTRSTLAAGAADAGLDGWLIPLGLPTVQPITAWLDDAGLRRRVMEASLRRGATPDHDNAPIVLEIVRLRAERARLLGLGSHAEHVLAVETAGSPEAARGLLLVGVLAVVALPRLDGTLGLGPALTPVMDLPDLLGCEVDVRINGRSVHRTRCANMMKQPVALLTAIGQFMTLQAGDALPVALGQHVVLEPWALPGAGDADAPVLFQWDPVAVPPHHHRARAARDWELGVVLPLQELVRALAGAGRAVGAAAVQVTAAAGRLGAGLAGFALGRVMATAAPGEKEVCMKSGCSA